MFTCRIILYDKCLKYLLDSCFCLCQAQNIQSLQWRCQRSHKGPWESQYNLLGIHLWHHGIKYCWPQLITSKERGTMSWCFMGWNQSPETHVSLNVILRLIGPPRGCPLKAMRFSLKRFHGWALLPTNPTNSHSVIYDLGSPSTNYCVWKEPQHGKKRNKAPRLLQKKTSFLTVRLHSSQKGPKTRTNHLMTAIHHTMAENVYNGHVKVGGVVGAN